MFKKTKKRRSKRSNGKELARIVSAMPPAQKKLAPFFTFRGTSVERFSLSTNIDRSGKFKDRYTPVVGRRPY